MANEGTTPISTPRTDAVEVEIREFTVTGELGESYYVRTKYVEAKFARQIERELIAMQALAAQAAKGSRSESTESILPPADANGKRPRLFYWEEAEDCWCPAETLKVEDIISVDLFMGDGQTEEVRFKRMDMTDAEFAAIPEG